MHIKVEYLNCIFRKIHLKIFKIQFLKPFLKKYPFREQDFTELIHVKSNKSLLDDELN